MARCTTIMITMKTMVPTLASSSRANSKPANRRTYKPTPVDRIIDEICITEIKYHDIMDDLKKTLKL